MELNFSLNFFDQIEVLLVAILMWVIIYALLKTKSPFQDEKINASIAFISAIIVSLSGVVTYIVAYSSTIFGILLFISFLIIIMLNFLDVNLSSLKINPKIIAGVIGIIFLFVFIQGFFGVNNEFSVENYNNQNMTNSSQINTNPNIGFGEMEMSSGSQILDSIRNIDSDLLSAVIFLLIMGIFIVLMR